ncbi:sugar phosphate isomerase/epimerase family protein [Flavihumibacter stibioxidans]|uniref:Sugar phosphate isomerase n=1 Tax=Flavihumibacter stibioxidans TaxID=1834163 RepID=A0ABR7M4H0_9BACT|nr:sugar phosphate isomerase/epimerase [Flavihumibacter stibioxidans]MBC6489872.1 sugar phosphate isomerase [Flavihumibacter stibioxidans]
MKKLVALLFCASVMYGAKAQSLGDHIRSRIGIQAYTFRNSFQHNIPATLDTIKQMGLTNLELYTLWGKTASEIKQLLDEKGMVCTSFGASYDDLVNKTDEVGMNATTLGASFVMVAWIPHKGPFNAEVAKQAAEDFNRAGKILKEKYGVTFCYHNHGYEFIPYEKGDLFDLIVSSTNPDWVSFELDLLWAQFPGVDPVKLLKKYGSRIKLMHVKDLRKGVKGDFSGGTSTENDVMVGTGQVNFPAVMKAARKAGLVWLYIEDESSHIHKQVPGSLKYLYAL